MWSELGYYSRMAAGIVRTQRTPIPADPVVYIRKRVSDRESAFLRTAERAIFGLPGNPYREMFAIAGCDLDDLSALVRKNGLEASLERLRREGVYLSHDEWKGKIPIIRSGRSIPGGSERFKNPFVNGFLKQTSSGSTGRPIPSSHSTESLIHACVYQKLRGREFAHPKSVWIDLKPILPYPGGLSSVLRGKRTETPVEKWFSVSSGFWKDGPYLMATRAMVALGNLAGAGATFPSYLPPNNFAPVSEYLARRRAQGVQCMLHGFASPMVRVAATALEKGHDISGSIFFCGGEALSPAKRAIFEKAGVRPYSSYTMSELGHIGSACRHMQGSCVHLYEDTIAVIGVPRSVSYADEEVNSLHFTTLALHAPNILLNVEMDDGGVIEKTSCDCTYNAAGLGRRIDQITSFGKMTPQGITFHRTDLVEVVELALPARLGGGPGDFQLVECEAGNGQTQLRLHVSPRVGVTDQDRIREAFLAIVRPKFAGALATREWTNSQGVEVVIAEPFSTRTGKVHPLRLLGAYSKSVGGPPA